MSDCLWPHGLQHARPPCPSPTPGVHSNSSPLSRWCQPTISSSVVPFSSCLQSFTVSGYFPMSHLFASGGQSIGVSASASVLPMDIQNCFPLGWTGWICLQSKGLSRVFSNTTVQNHPFFSWEVRLCPFCNLLLITQFNYIQCRRGCTRPWTPGVKGNWCHFGRKKTKTKICKVIVELMLSNCGVGEDSWESLGQQRDQTSQY